MEFIQNDPNVPTKIENEVAIPKSTQEWNKFDKKKVQLHAWGIYYLYYVVDRNEHNCVYQCEFTKDIYRLLESTHEETNQVKE